MSDTDATSSDHLPPLDADILLIDAVELARRLSISRRTLHRLVVTNTAPQPIRLGRRSLWRVEEIEEWVRDGCPPMARWDRLRELPLKPPTKPRRARRARPPVSV